MKKEILNNSFVFYATNLEVIETLEGTDKELANQFMKAIIEYGIYGEYENTNPIIKVLMVQAGFGIDKAKDRYAVAVENGKKGGRPKIDLDNDVLSVMRDRGMSYQEIANKLGVSKSTIQRRFKKIDSALVSNGVKTQNLNVNVNDNENENVNVKVNGNSTAINWNFTAPVRKNELKTEEAIFRKNELKSSQMRKEEFAKTNLKVRKNGREIDNINNIDIIDKEFLPTEEILDGFAIEPIKQESINQNNETAEGTISKCAEGTISECGTQFQNVSLAQSDIVYNIKEINNNNKKEIDIGDFVAPQQNPATSLATQVSSVKQVEAVGADKVITINCSDMRDSYYHLYKYLAKYQPTLASFVVNGVAFCRSNKERTDKAIEICNTLGYTIEFNDTAAAVANV